MGETFLLTLEVDDQGSIKVQNFKKNVEEVGGATEKTGKQAEGGFHIFGVAASKGAEAVGVPYRASHLLGTKVEELARKTFPAWGTALGVAGGAAVVAAGAIMFLYERKKQLREETAKHVDDLKGEVLALYSDVEQSLALKDATIALGQAKKIMLEFELAKKLRDENEEYDKQIEKYNKLVEAFNKGKGIIEGVSMQETSDWIDEIGAKVDTLGAQIKADEALQRLLGIKGAKESNIDLDEIGFEKKAFDEEMRLREIQAEQKSRDRQLDLEGEKAYLDLRKELGIMSISEQMAAESEIWNAETYDKEQDMIRAAASEDQINKMRVNRAIQWETQRAKQAKQIRQMELQNTGQILGMTSQLFDQFYKLGNERQKAFFYISRAAAAAEAVIQGYVAASKAVGQMGPLGISMSTYLIGFGYANAAMILAQAYESANAGGGGGGGAMPTYDANPVTGQPANGGYTYYGYDQSHYGTGWRPGEGPNETHMHFYGDVYDKESFDKRVNKSVQQNIKDRGETRDTIQRYV